VTSLRRPSAQAASRRAHGQTSWSTFSRQARLSQAKAGASRATGARTDPRKDRRAEGQARQSPRRRRRRLSLRRPPATPAVLGSCGHEWCWSSLGGRLAPRRRRRTRLRSCARDARSVRLKRATSARSARRSVFVSMKRAVDQVRFGCGGFTGRGRVGGSEQTPCCSATITMTTTSTAPAAPCCHRRVPQSPPSRVPSAWGVTPAASAMGEDVAGVSSTASGPDPATPCRHRPPLIRLIVGEVIGFALQWDGQVQASSGSRATPCSTTSCARSPTACRSAPPSCIWGGRFPISGPVRYTMTAKEAVELCRLARPRTVIPIHEKGEARSRKARGDRTRIRRCT